MHYHIADQNGCIAEVCGVTAWTEFDRASRALDRLPCADGLGIDLCDLQSCATTECWGADDA